jgi:hypothetical protein
MMPHQGVAKSLLYLGLRQHSIVHVSSVDERPCSCTPLSSCSSGYHAAKRLSPPPGTPASQGMQKARGEEGVQQVGHPTQQEPVICRGGAKGGRGAAGWLAVAAAAAVWAFGGACCVPGHAQPEGWLVHARPKPRPVPVVSAFCGDKQTSAGPQGSGRSQNHDEGGPRSPVGDHGPEGTPCRSSWFVGPPQPCRQRPG